MATSEWIYIEPEEGTVYKFQASGLTGALNIVIAGVLEWGEDTEADGMLMGEASTWVFASKGWKVKLENVFYPEVPKDPTSATYSLDKVSNIK